MPLKVLIVGAGIGGPATAAALARKGHKVTIYERATSTTDVGFAFRITPNSDKCLKYLGIDTIAGGAVAANGMRMLDQDGKLLAERRENADPHKAKKGVSVFAYRPQLAKQLIDAAIHLGVEIKTGVKVTSVDTEKTELTLGDQTVVSGDLIIGCDGLHSAVRPYVFDTTQYFPMPSSHHDCIRFVLSKSDIDNDPDLHQLINDDYRMATWKDDTKRLLVYPVDFGNQYNITCTHPESLSDTTEDNDEEQKVLYDQKISRESASKIYSNLEPRARRIFELANADGFRFWKLHDIEEVPTWSKNCTLLTGDAAHAVLPFGFSGASMAIEDGIVLGELLDEKVEVEQIPARLRLLEELRKPRIRRVRETGRDIAKGLEDKVMVEEYFSFLSEYDAVEEGRKAWKECK